MKRKKWRLNLTSALSASLARGEKIVVWLPHAKALVCATVQKVRRGSIFYRMRKDVLWRAAGQVAYRLDYSYASIYRTGHVRRRLEHVEWEREADSAAFIAGIALELT